MLGDAETVRRLQIALDWVQITIVEGHITGVILHINRTATDIHRDESIRSYVPLAQSLRYKTVDHRETELTGQIIRGNVPRVGAQHGPVVAIASLWVTRGTGEDVVCVVVEVVAEAVIVPVQDDAVVSLNDINERC